jgi:hypothetical protein
LLTHTASLRGVSQFASRGFIIYVGGWDKKEIWDEDLEGYF